jgi:hypothetical protein
MAQDGAASSRKWIDWPAVHKAWDEEGIVSALPEGFIEGRWIEADTRKKFRAWVNLLPGSQGEDGSSTRFSPDVSVDYVSYKALGSDILFADAVAAMKATIEADLEGAIDVHWRWPERVRFSNEATEWHKDDIGDWYPSPGSDRQVARIQLAVLR